MADICTKCGLPKELCICETIAKEGQRIKVKTEKRRYGKLMTVIEGISHKEINLKEVSKKLKSKFACGGTVKGDTIELQGDHKNRIKEELINLGFAAETIDIE